jgi:hypothetical protein
LHLWCQIVGKIRMACGPWVNHSWGVTLAVTSRGFGTSLVPYRDRAFELDLDVVDSRLHVTVTDGGTAAVPLDGRSVAAFHADVLAAMADLGLDVAINPLPSEIPGAVPFSGDDRPRGYDPDHARSLWLAMVQAHRVLGDFRAGFLGKASPVHLFWGSFDLATTRFSGRSAPPHPGGLPHFPLEVAREAYSHEVTSCGFWPGNADAPTPVFYAYAYPTPAGFADVPVEPPAATWVDELGEFVLPYDAVREADDPDATLLAFLERTHAAAADLAGWDRSALECRSPHGPDWWRTRPHG